MDITLERFAYTPYGTFGKFKYGNFECYSLEDPWNNNRTGVSCIPVGFYTLADTRYNAGGYDTFEVQNVPNRSYIKIHKGNTHKDIEGCIIVGQKLGMLDGQWAILESGFAFGDFITETEVHGKPGHISIYNYTGGVVK